VRAADKEMLTKLVSQILTAQDSAAQGS
jgi:hypothetical protein